MLNEQNAGLRILFFKYTYCILDVLSKNKKALNTSTDDETITSKIVVEAQARHHIYIRLFKIDPFSYIGTDP